METKEIRLARNTIIIFISKFSTQFLSFLILPFLTAKLSTSEYGSFDLISTYSWLLAALMSLQVENGIFRFLIDNRENFKNKKKIISNGITIICVQTIILLIIYVALRNIINFENGLYVIAVSISLLVLNIPLQISRGEGKNVVYAKASIITGVMNVIFCFLFVYYIEKGLWGIVFANILSNLCGAIYIIVKDKLYIYYDIREVNKNEAKEILRYSLPLLPNSVSSWIISISDKVMITFFLGTSANGIYSISTKFSILLSHVYSVFNLSWTESASISANEEDRNEFFSKSIERIFFLCSSLCLLVLAAMPIVFRILINDSYSESYLYIPILVFATFFEIFSGLLGAIYISLKKSKKLAITTVIGAMINILINFLLLNKYGIIIACISTVLSYIVVAVYRYIDIKRFIKLKLNIKKYSILVATICVIIFLYYKNSILISLISILVVIFISLVLNNEIIKSLKEKIQLKNLKY